MDSVDALVLGLGGVVKKEDEKVNEAPDLYPQRTTVVVDVER